MKRRPMAPGGAVVGTIMAVMVFAAGCNSDTAVAVLDTAAASLTITVEGAGAPMPVTSDQIQLEVGDSVSLRATATNPLGFAIQPGAVSWSSSDAGVAQVSAEGVVRATGPGGAGILAAAGEASAAITVVVSDTVTVFPAAGG